MARTPAAAPLRAAAPGAVTATAAGAASAHAPVGVTTVTAVEVRETTGSRVPKLISRYGRPALDSQVLDVTTVATVAVAGVGLVVTCRLGTQPG